LDPLKSTFSEGHILAFRGSWSKLTFYTRYIQWPRLASALGPLTILNNKHPKIGLEFSR